MIYLLDTNLVSHVIRDDIPGPRQHLKQIAAYHDIAVSAVSAGELFYDLARRGYPKAMTQAIAVNATLASRDKAFGHLNAHLQVEDWTV